MKKLTTLLFILISFLGYSQTPFPSGIRLLNATEKQSDSIAVLDGEGILNGYIHRDSLGGSSYEVGYGLSVENDTLNVGEINGALGLRHIPISEDTDGFMFGDYLNGDVTTAWIRNQASNSYNILSRTGLLNASDAANLELTTGSENYARIGIGNQTDGNNLRLSSNFGTLLRNYLHGISIYNYGEDDIEIRNFNNEHSTIINAVGGGSIVLSGGGSGNHSIVSLPQENSTLTLLSRGFMGTLTHTEVIGLMDYDEDHSEDYTERSIVDKNYVDKNRLVSYTVSTLPVSPTIGDQAIVTDANAPTWNTIVTGGGTTVCMVYYNGTNWIAH